VLNLQQLKLPADYRCVVLTGAGISAESGIPTYRGKDGLWTVGSKDYRPQELATLRAFERDPRAIWSWYFYRRGCCLEAQPNGGHQALNLLQQGLGSGRCSLVTQNVDGLHARSGIKPESLFEIHGNLHSMRCTLPCSPERFSLDDSQVLQRGDELDEVAWAKLKCPYCGAMARPHVLWFDECYDEVLYRSGTVLDRLAEADLLLVIGTSGATTLPVMMVRRALASGTAIIEVNPEPSAFTAAIRTYDRGMVINKTASDCLPGLVQTLVSTRLTKPA
jgi:NAD-dependent deacetylase